MRFNIRERIEMAKAVFEAHRAGHLRGQVGINMLVGLAIGLVVVGLVLGFGSLILGDVQATMTENTTEYNATGNALTGLLNLSAQLGNVGTIAAAVVIIGLIVVGFAVFSRGGR